MIKHVPVDSSQVNEKEWVVFPGGELEGRRPKALCASCRRHAEAKPSTGSGSSRAARAPLCFQCYRLDLDRQCVLKAAGALDTASDERFQTTLPFEAVNVARLERLRAERATARAELQNGAGRFERRRRRAQIAARHALQRITAGLKRQHAERESRRASAGQGDVVLASDGGAPQELQKALAAAAHTAELQLPDAWLPFVVSR